MAQRDDRKRLGKKHRQASTRPKKGRAPRVTPTTGAVAPRKRKVLSTKRAALENVGAERNIGFRKVLLRADVAVTDHNGVGGAVGNADEGKPVKSACRQRQLQAVVVRLIDVPHLINEAEIRE